MPERSSREPTFRGRRHHVFGRGPVVAAHVRTLLGRVVQDRTGLTGRYKIDLDYPFVLLRNSDLTAQDPRPSLFTVIREQWGMKLEPSRGQFKRIVVDDAQRPTEN